MIAATIDAPVPTVGPDGSVPDQPAAYFHGTTYPFRAGDKVLPSTRHGRRVNYVGVTDPEYAYATTSPDDAWWYAEGAWGMPRPADEPADYPRVYRVRPLGTVETDPAYDEHGRSRSNFEADVRSTAGFEVVEELPMPEALGTPEDWR